MKVINKPIEMIARYDIRGVPSPYRFRMITEDESRKVIQVNRIIYQERVKELFPSKQYCYIFLCSSVDGGLMIEYELKFQIETCKWVLYRM